METYDLPNGGQLIIEQDDDAIDPRREMENLGTMACFHNRYDLGDEQQPDQRTWLERLAVELGYPIDKYADAPSEKLGEYVKKRAVILPLYLYDHSGLAMSTGSFIGRAHHAEWDSGQVGYIYVARDKALKEWGRKRWSKRLREKVVATLESEVETYNQFLQGDVWMYRVEDKEGDFVDGCAGFFGYEYMVSQLPANLRRVVNRAG